MKHKLQELVNKHCFAIYEYSQTKDEDKLLEFDKELYLILGFNIRPKCIPINGSWVFVHEFLHTNRTISYDNYFHVKTP